MTGSSGTQRAIPSVIGRWRVLSELGRGAAGVVYLAERDDGELDQKVAIKVLRPDLSSANMIRRFERERRMLSLLDHPQIAKVLDAGTGIELEDFSPYFVMEHVDGLAIDRYCAVKKLSLRERLKLFCEVCAVVGHAHRNLIVHRDLKPSNILVKSDGRPKLLDFGIAKWLDQRHGEETASHEVWLTPAYAAPEQIRGEPISTATDVYALGVLLYQLLTGTTPFGVEGGAGLAQLAATVSKREPLRPSQAAAVDPGENRPPEVDLSTQLEGDLDAIILLALRRDPLERYASVEDLIEDIEAFLDDLPVSARGDDRRYRLRLFLKRHRRILLSAAALFIIALGSSTYLFRQALRLEAERDRAEIERVRAEEVSRFMIDLFERPVPGARKPLALETIRRGADRLDNALLDQPAVKTKVALVLAKGSYMLGDLNGSKALYEVALDLTRRNNTGNHVDEVYSLVGIGAALTLTGRLSEAESVASEVLVIAKSIGGAEALAEALKLRGGLYLYQGRIDKAVSALKLGVFFRGQAFGEDSIEVGRDLGNLVGCQNLLGRFDEARVSLKRLESIKKAAYPHAAIGSKFHMLLEEGRLEEAEELWVANSQEFLAKASSRERADFLIGKAILEEQHGRPDSAMKFLLTARAILEDLKMKNQARDLRDFSLDLTFGSVLVVLGQLDAAEAELAGVSVTVDATLPGDHPFRAELSREFGILKMKRGQLDEAERHLRFSVAMASAKAPDNLGLILRYCGDLAEILEKQGKRKEACACFRDASAANPLQARASAFRSARQLDRELECGLQQSRESP